MALKCLFCIKCWQANQHNRMTNRDNCQNCHECGEMTNSGKLSENWNKFYMTEHTAPGYDCLIMMSGGKDSLYALSKIVQKKNLNPLCYTFEHPCLNNASKSNIEKICRLFDVKWIFYKTNDMVLREIFADFYKEKQKFSSYCSHKIACGFCTSFLILTAFELAYKFNIPYVIYCADPEQLKVIPMDFTFFASVINNMGIREKFFKIYNENIFNIIIEKQDEEKWPCLISPFAEYNKEYTSENIINDLLLQKIDYVALNPEATRCSLHPIIRLQALADDKCFYHVFESLFNTDFLNPANAGKKQILDKYRMLYIKFAHTSNITEQDLSDLKTVLQELFLDSQFKDTWKIEYNSIVNLHDNIQRWNLTNFI